MLNLVHNFKKLGKDFYSDVTPQKLLNPQILDINTDLLKTLDLTNLSYPDIENILFKNQLSNNYSPIATVYSGHQFGYKVNQLGDGRAIIIAEHMVRKNKIYELQLKGAGKTPYSRGADGLAVVRSSIREYIASIAMQSFNIPSTDALAIATSDTKVHREVIENAALVLRVAPSFIRFGHFEYFANQNRTSELQILGNFVIQNYYPEINIESKNAIYDFFAKVVEKTAILIAKWQAIGFVHGVMNTDNMSILGLTIDYGPYAFIDKFIPNYIYNHSDNYGRYTYTEQISVAYWNLERLMDALILIAPDSDKLKTGLTTYIDIYNATYLELMVKKLGVDSVELIQTFLEILYKYQMDYTFSFRQLSYGRIGFEKLKTLYNTKDDFDNWYQTWNKKVVANKQNLIQTLELMQQINPAIVPRTHLLQKVITDVENNDNSSFDLLLKALKNPFMEYKNCQHLYTIPDPVHENICLSCSS